jgi:hypothetical protein
VQPGPAAASSGLAFTGMSCRVPENWSADFADVTATVFASIGAPDEWRAVSAELVAAFAATRDAFRAGRSVVYVVHTDDLLGRRGAGGAMVATGLLSAARTAALEGRRDAITVNVLGVEADSAPDTIARWATLLSEGDRPTGELVHLGAGHLGRALA